MRDALAVPTTDLNESDIDRCISGYGTMWKHQVTYGTYKQLSEQGELFKDILQRVILLAQFEACHHKNAKLYACGLKG